MEKLRWNFSKTDAMFSSNAPALSSKRPASYPVMTPSEAIEVVKRLSLMYPQSKGSLTNEFLTACAAVLIDFPREVARACVDEYRGIAQELKFHPSLAELREWCEIEAQKRSEPLRAYPLLPAEPAPDRSKRLSYAELNRKYGDGKGGWGIG